MIANTTTNASTTNIEYPSILDVQNIHCYDECTPSSNSSRNSLDEEIEQYIKAKGKKQHTLQNMYYKFTHNSPCMDSLQFCKLCRDCKIIDEELSIAQVDITFIEIKGMYDKKINFGQFKQALNKLATKKGCTRVEIVRCIRNTHSPMNQNKEEEKEFTKVVEQLDKKYQRTMSNQWKQ